MTTLIREEAILIKDGEHPLLPNEEINPQNVLLLTRDTRVFFYSLKKNQGMICLLHELS